MSYQNHPAVLSALQTAENWLQNEGGKTRPSSIAREMVKLTCDGLDRQTLACRIAAFGLLLGQHELNAHNIAWLVRDGTIGHPERPTFNLNKETWLRFNEGSTT